MLEGGTMSFVYPMDFFLLGANFCESVVDVCPSPKAQNPGVYLPFCLSHTALLWESRIVQLSFCGFFFFYTIWQVKFWYKDLFNPVLPKVHVSILYNL